VRQLFYWLLNWLTSFFRTLPVPPSVLPVLNGEVFMADVRDGLVYSVSLPEFPKAGDLKSQLLCVHFDGKKVEHPLDVNDTETSFIVPQDVEASIHLVYVDDGGNKSEGPLFSFKAVDTINTFAPPGFGEVKLVEEVFDVEWSDEGLPIIEEADPEPDFQPEIVDPQGPTI
jgi:hypothetical protein